MFIWSNLEVKRTKFYKKKKILNKGVALIYGKYGLKVLENGFLYIHQIEAIFKVLKKIGKPFKKKLKIWIPIVPNLLLTKKPIATRMGRGKGKADTKVVFIQKGKIILEWSGIPFILVQNALHKISKKMPFLGKLVLHSL